MMLVVQVGNMQVLTMRSILTLGLAGSTKRNSYSTLALLGDGVTAV